MKTICDISDIDFSQKLSDKIQNKSNNLSMLYDYLIEHKKDDKTTITDRCLESEIRMLKESLERGDNEL